MNFQHLRHFVVTADTGNMQKAAEVLKISQSGLSRSIGALETSLGMPLFERSTKGVELTAFGHRFYPHARLMLNEYNRSMDELKTFQNLKGGSLRIGINNNFAYFLIPDVVAELLSRWPGIHIDIINGEYVPLMNELSQGNIDIAFSYYTHATKFDHLQYEEMFQIQTRVFSRLGHPLQTMENLGPEDFARAGWCLISGAAAQAVFDSYFVDNGQTSPQIAMQCASVTLLATVVAKSDLLTILPEEFIGRSREFSIEPLENGPNFGQAQVGLIRRKGSFDSPIAERLSPLLQAATQRLFKEVARA